jgi:two-component system sensor histidine kinase/response regulator
MKTSNPASFEQLLLPEQFNQLQTLLEETGREIDAVILTDAAFPSLAEAKQPQRVERFVLVISAPFSALLQGKPLTNQPAEYQAGYQTSLSFEPEAILQFVQDLIAECPDASSSPILQQQSVIGPNQIQYQNQFTLKLFSLLAVSSHCPATEAALRQQIEQERLLNQVTTQIRQSLELPVILKTAVEQVRQHLQVDRLVIYQLDAAMTTAEPNITPVSGQVVTQYGSVIYEARASETIPSVMNLSDAHCFTQMLRRQNWQTLEIADAIEDVEVRYHQAPCLLEFLRHAQVRAKLIAPIRLPGQLWGLLIAHECTQPRRWQESERRFLQQIAGTLAIAISQAQLYSEVQQQKQTLEARIIERTQALRDAMMTAQSANQAKSEFLATVSHELRTPLACIIGMSATLQRWSKDVLTERQQHFLQTIHESGEHLLTLINDILDLSQAEAGRLMLNSQPFSLSGLAQQSLKAFSAQAESQEIELELDLRIDPGRDSFTADQRRLRQILFNLLSNAIKFTPSGGKVTLRVYTQPDLAIFQVADTGIGIAEPQLPLLFQKFQQLDSGYQREYQGTGLGLALTKQLVELHGGRIGVESSVGVGSVFTVKLPNQTVVNPANRPESQYRSQTEGRIVLVESNEDSASLICDLLLAAGYQVIWMLEGAALLNQLEVLTPAAVILNLNLPDIDGHRLIHSLRQNPTTKHLKLLALIPEPLNHSANNLLDRLEVNRSAGQLQNDADDAVFLPVRPEILLQKVRSLMLAE